MKRLVNLFQFAIVIAILYPVYYVWDTGRVDNFCELVKPGMSLSELQQLADDNNIKLNAPQDTTKAGGQWMTSVESRAALDRYACVIMGAVERVATAHIVRAE